jgi:hypothetical protein
MERMQQPSHRAPTQQFSLAPRSFVERIDASRAARCRRSSSDLAELAIGLGYVYFWEPSIYGAIMQSIPRMTLSLLVAASAYLLAGVPAESQGPGWTALRLVGLLGGVSVVATAAIDAYRLCAALPLLELTINSDLHGLCPYLSRYLGSP